TRAVWSITDGPCYRCRKRNAAALRAGGRRRHVDHATRRLVLFAGALFVHHTEEVYHARGGGCMRGNKLEIRRPKSKGNPGRVGRVIHGCSFEAICSDFGLRNFCGFRISAFGFLTALAVALTCEIARAATNETILTLRDVARLLGEHNPRILASREA